MRKLNLLKRLKTFDSDECIQLGSMSLWYLVVGANLDRDVIYCKITLVSCDVPIWST